MKDIKPQNKQQSTQETTLDRAPIDSLENTDIVLTDINKSYQKGSNKVVVHDNFNLTIKSGEFVALMGPSGLGKSTLLHLIGGLDQPTSGSVTIGNQRIDNLSEGKLTKWRAESIGFVFQSHHLLPVLSAHGNVELPWY